MLPLTQNLFIYSSTEGSQRGGLNKLRTLKQRRGAGPPLFRGLNFKGFVQTQKTTLFSWQSFKQRQCHRDLCPTRDRKNNNK